MPLDPAAYFDTPPSSLGSLLRAADAAIGALAARAPGSKSAVLHAIFSHAEPIKDSIARHAPAGTATRCAHVDGVLQAAFFLVRHALGTVHANDTDYHFSGWWAELNGRGQLCDIASERAAGAGVGEAMDVLRRARWEWGSYAARRKFAGGSARTVQGKLNEEFGSADGAEVRPRDMVEVVEAVVGAAEVIVQVCWPRTQV